MNLEKEVYKKLVKEIKKDIKENAAAGGDRQRIRLLSYGLIKKTPYRTIESKTNEDKCCSIGQNTCKRYLSHCICHYLKKYDLVVNDSDVIAWLKEPLAQQEAA